MPVASPRTIRPAATVIVLRDTPQGPEVFMVRRHEGHAFMGGAHVFPGGRVDPADGAGVDASWCDGLAEAGIASLPDEVAVAHRVAAIRELFEEAGLLLAVDHAGRAIDVSGPVRERFDGYRRDIHAGTVSLKTVAERETLRLALGALTPLARWVTPPIDVRQFDAWFFITPMPPGQTPVADDIESTLGVWLRPADALAQATAGTIVLPPPTWTTLRELESSATVAEAVASAGRRRIEPRQPLAYEHDGARFLLLPGDPLNPTPWHEPLPAETRFRRVGERWVAESAPRRA